MKAPSIPQFDYDDDAAKAPRPGPKPRFGLRWLRPGEHVTIYPRDFDGVSSLQQLQTKASSLACRNAKRFNAKYTTRIDRDGLCVRIYRVA